MTPPQLSLVGSPVPRQGCLKRPEGTAPEVPELGVWDDDLRVRPPYTGVSTPPTPEIPKKSQKGVPGPPGPECQKSVEKVPNDSKMSQKDSKKGVRGLFRHFF